MLILPKYTASFSLTKACLAGRQSQLVNNIITVFKEATHSDITNGMSWYQEAYKFIKYVSSTYNLSVDVVAGVTSALSPQCFWEKNMRYTIEAIEQFQLSGNVQNVGMYSNNCRKAARILENNSAGDEFDTKYALKTKAFYQALRTVHNTNAVVIDSHAAAIALGMVHVTGTIKVSPSSYPIISAAYTQAAMRLSILPRDLQAICWVTRKRLLKTHSQTSIEFASEHGLVTA